MRVFVLCYFKECRQICLKKKNTRLGDRKPQCPAQWSIWIVSIKTKCVCLQGRVLELPAGPEPPFFRNPPNLMTMLGADKSPVNTSFGDVLEQVLPLYRKVEKYIYIYFASNKVSPPKVNILLFQPLEHKCLLCWSGNPSHLTDRHTIYSVLIKSLRQIADATSNHLFFFFLS